MKNKRTCNGDYVSFSVGHLQFEYRNHTSSPIQYVIWALVQIHRKNHVPNDPMIFSMVSFELVSAAAHRLHFQFPHYSHR